MPNEESTPTPKQPDAAKELELMQSIYASLKDQPPQAQHRVVAWVCGALGLSSMPARSANGRGHSVVEPRVEYKEENSGGYETFADLYNATNPSTAAEMALVAGYWFQICRDAEDFVAAEVNAELKMVGARVTNITVAFNGLINATPRLVLQLKKSGKAQQARKQYKLTVAGIRAVEDMIKPGGE